MKILPLITAPDPFLKKISKPVLEVDNDLREFMKNMVATMYQENGIGLASVQVGELKRVLVMDIDYEIDDHDHHHHHGEGGCSGVHVKNANPQYFINPEIIEFSKNDSVFNEGCLSFPGARAEVTRPESIKLKYLDFNGEKQVKEFDGISATCLQHEIDHLNGITFVDKISPIKREMILKRMKKIKQNG
jgi:peptide deformylase